MTWSLEIEVQFYLLMPVLARLYKISNTAIRRALLFGSIILCVVAQQFYFPSLALATQSAIWLSLIGHLQFFLVGMFLADFYVLRGDTFGIKRRLWDWVSLIGWPFMIAIWPFPRLSAFVFPAAIVLLFIATFRGPVTNCVAKSPPLTVIGGMCYSIYLLHLQLIGLLGPRFHSIFWRQSFAVTDAAQTILLGVPLLCLCAIYFVLVEKPCMNRNWPNKLGSWIQSRAARNAEGETTA